MVLNRRDKEQLVIKLHQEGKTIREIASSAHMSFTDIGEIIRKIDGRDNDDGVEVNRYQKQVQRNKGVISIFKRKKTYRRCDRIRFVSIRSPKHVRGVLGIE